MSSGGGSDPAEPSSPSPLPARRFIPRITDPRAVPVTGTDTHLPALAPAALDEGAVRRQFASVAGFEPERRGDGGLLDGATTRAAVLVPLVARPSGLQVLLTQRSSQLRDHAGQISFPGGRVEPEDPSLEAAALREAEEEIGLARDHVEVLGALPRYITVTRYEVTPVVGLVQPRFELRTDVAEVEEAFEVPLAHLMNPAHHQHHRFELDGLQRSFLSMPWREPGGREFFIWGATAAMLRNLYRLLAR